MEKDKLSELAASGPDPTRGLQHLVLSRFADVAKARSRLRRWDEIAEALDMPGRAKALSSAFSKVKKGIAEKRLTPPAPAPAPTPRQKPQAQPAASPAPGYYPPPGQKQVPTEGMSDLDKIRAEFPD